MHPILAYTIYDIYMIYMISYLYRCEEKIIINISVVLTLSCNLIDIYQYYDILSTENKTWKV